MQASDSLDKNHHQAQALPFLPTGSYAIRRVRGSAAFHRNGCGLKFKLSDLWAGHQWAVHSRGKGEGEPGLSEPSGVAGVAHVEAACAGAGILVPKISKVRRQRA